MRCAYKRPTALICSINAFLVIYVVYGILIIPHNLQRSHSDMVARLNTPSINATALRMKYTLEEIERAQEARRAVEAVDLMKRVQELVLESTGGDVKQNEEVKNKASQEEELEDLAMQLEEMGSSNPVRMKEGTGVADLSQSVIAEQVGEQVTEQVTEQITEQVTEQVTEQGIEQGTMQGPGQAPEQVPPAAEKPEDQLEGGKLRLHGPEIEDGIIPGRPLPKECNGEAHTDYDGFAVTWGLTHHQESAADCCQACLTQAEEAKEGEKKCNVWVYCPAEEGCYSPDIYEHKQFECWLKQDDEPHLNFKGRYSPDYRQAHPNCPQVVAWVSGLIS